MNTSYFNKNYLIQQLNPPMDESYMSTFNGINMYRHKLNFKNNNHKIIHGVTYMMQHWLLSFERNGISFIGLKLRREQTSQTALPYYEFSTINYFIPRNDIKDIKIIKSNYLTKEIYIKAINTLINCSIHRICKQMLFNHHTFKDLNKIIQNYN